MVGFDSGVQVFCRFGVSCRQTVCPFAAVDRSLAAPAARSIALIPAHPLLQCRRKPMHPSHHRLRVYFHATLLHHLHRIPIPDAVLAVPADTKQNDLNGKAPTLEHDPSNAWILLKAPARRLMQQSRGTSVAEERANSSGIERQPAGMGHQLLFQLAVFPA